MIQLDQRIHDVESCDGGFEILSHFSSIYATSVVIATGGLSIPKIGATGFGYDIAQKFGLSIVQTRPGLVPLTFDKEIFDLGGVFES